MIIVNPVTVAEDNYIGGNLVNTLYDEWAAGESYTRGDYRRVGTDVYQALQDHTSSNANSPSSEAELFANPLADDPEQPNWVYVSKTNRWKLFDGRPSQQAENQNTISASVRLPRRISAVGVMEVSDCSAVEVSVVTGGDRAVLSWSTPAAGDTPIQRYEYRQKLSTTNTWDDWTEIIGSGSDTESFTVRGLTDKAVYDFQVRAVNGAGAADDSNTARMTVEEVSPSAEGGAGGAAGTVRPSAVTDLAAAQTRVFLYNRAASLIDKSAVSNWWTYFFAPVSAQDSAVFTDIPVTSKDDAVYVTLSGGQNLKCGQIVMGLGHEVGEATTGDSGFEGLDFSAVETNIYGDLITVERAATDVYRFDVLVETSQVNSLAALLRQLKGGARALWVGDEEQSIRAWAYGFYRDYQVYYSDGVHARLRLTVQGVV